MIDIDRLSTVLRSRDGAAVLAPEDTSLTIAHKHVTTTVAPPRRRQPPLSRPASGSSFAYSGPAGRASISEGT